MTQAQDLAFLSQAHTAGSLSWRNRWMNGAMRVSQRGGVTNAANGLSYTAVDRHYIWPNGSTVQTANDWACPAGMALHIIGAAGNTGTAVGQRFEFRDIIDWGVDGGGKIVTFSGWYMTPTAYQPIVTVSKPRAQDNYGSGWDSVVAGAGVTVPNGLAVDAWRYFYYTFAVPASTYYVGMQVEIGLGPVLAGKNAALGGLQLESGSIPTPFECRPTAIELLMCQRFYEKGCISTMQTVDAGGRLVGGTAFFKTSKRISPAMTLTRDFTVNAQPTSSVFVLPDASGALIYAASGAAGPVEIRDFYIANAEL